jgi:serpin B
LKPAAAIAAATGAALLALGAGAQAPAPGPAHDPATAPAPASAPEAAEKRIVLDSAPAAPASPSAPAAAASAPPAEEAARPATTPLGEAIAAATLADLGLQLLRQAPPGSAVAERNLALSPLSVAAALALVHAGSGGTTAAELAALVDPAVARGRFYNERLPALWRALTVPPGGPVTLASRLWARADLATAVPADYAGRMAQRFGATVGIFPGTAPEQARQDINAWVSGQTRGAIPRLLPPGSVKGSTKLVLANAVHFKSPWEQPFEPKATVPRPFATPDGVRAVPTMVSQRVVRRAVLDRMEVLELPFAAGGHRLLVAMPQAPETLAAAEARLGGAELASWSERLRPVTCRLHLPRFSVAPRVASLKAPLQALGVRQAFSDRADLRPMLGSAAVGTQLDEVFHAASVDVDERGGEAAAATAVTIVAKSLQMPAPDCAVDRPFLFAIVHGRTGAPLFVGRVTDPAATGR